MHSLVVTLLLSLVSITGCVGTIQENAEETTNSKDFRDFGITFNGVERAVAIAHNKVDLAFSPATGGSGIFTYVVYRDGNFATPAASVPGIATNLDAEGRFHVQVGGLSTGTSYTFTVRAYDVVNAVEDTNTIILPVTTLGYEVPIFGGIVALENLGGLDAETKLRVRWNVATPSSAGSDPFGANPNAVGGYNIYMGTAYDTMTLVGSVTNPAATSWIATGLTPGQNYFAMVRARNSASTPEEDLNIQYLQRRTLLNQPIQFNGIQSLTIPPTTLGYSQLQLGWTAGSGSFDRYRIFTSTAPVASFNPATDTPATGDITNLATTSFTLAVGVSPHTTYYVAVVACKDSACSEYAGHNVVRNVRTTPPVAPFSGIASITQPSDASGLSTLILNWAAPDITAGVYNTIRVFRTSLTGVYNPLTDELPIYNQAAPSTPGYDVGATSATGTTIRGLTTDTQYCFVAKAFATSPFDASNPNGRTHTNEVRQCATPQYTAPGFGGINSLCSAVSSSSFTITWNTPSPLGIFDLFYVWLKPVDGNPFSFDDAIAGDPAYELRVAAKNKTDLIVSGLSPNTTYQIGMRTYFYNSLTSSAIYDSNIVTTNCATSPAKVEHNGWAEVMALGRRMDGLAVPHQPMLERIRPGAVPYMHPYPQAILPPDTGTAGVDASLQGIIRLAWEDFTLTGGLGKISDYPALGNGYRVYRKNWIPLHNTVPPQLSDGDWGAPLNSTPVVASPVSENGQLKWVASFNDYTVTRAPAGPTETKIYWYKVEAVLNNLNVPYETTPPDGVIKVILPPDNMALMHRWMANRDICSKMNLPVIRSENYRCLYNGLGSTLSAGFNYYDMGKDALIERFGLSCPFSRGGTANACTAASPVGNWDGATSDPARGVIAGDCVIRDHTVTTVTAPNGAIMWDRTNNRCLRRQAGAWVNYHNMQAWNTPNSLSTYPVYDAVLYPSGTGLGGQITSNAANLPGLGWQLRNNLYHFCAGHTVTHKGVTLPKRLIRRKEYVAAASWHPLVSNVAAMEAGTVESGATDRDCNGTQHKGVGPLTLDFNNNRWNQFTASYPYMIYGSKGDYSTEACVSRYGIQDMVGNHSVGNSDTLICASGNPHCGFKFQDFDQTIPVNLSDPWIVDPGSIETWRNGDGTYFNLNAGTSDQGFSNTNSTASAATYSLTVIPNRVYFSVPLGMGLSCGGSTCANKTDDNVRVTPGPSAPGAVVTNFPNSIRPQIHRQQTFGPTWTSVSGPTIVTSGHSQLGAQSAYGMTAITSLMNITMMNAMCTVLLDD